MSTFKRKLARGLVERYIEKKFKPDVGDKVKLENEVYEELNRNGIGAKFYGDYLYYKVFSGGRSMFGFLKKHYGKLAIVLLLLTCLYFYKDFMYWWNEPPTADEKMRVISYGKGKSIVYYNEEGTDTSGVIEFGKQVKVWEGIRDKKGIYYPKSSTKKTIPFNYLVEECKYHLYMSIFSNLPNENRYLTDPHFIEALLDYYDEKKFIGSAISKELKNCIKYERISDIGGIWDLEVERYENEGKKYFGMDWGGFLSREPFINKLKAENKEEARNTAFIIVKKENGNIKEGRIVVTEVKPQTKPYKGEVKKVFNLDSSLYGFAISREGLTDPIYDVAHAISFYNGNADAGRKKATYYYSKSEDCLRKIEPESNSHFPEKLESIDP